MQRFNKLFGGLIDNAAEREYRLNVACLPKLESNFKQEKSIKDNNESLPSFSFQHDSNFPRTFSPVCTTQRTNPFSQNQHSFRSGFQKTSAFKDSSNIPSSSSPIRVANRHVLKSRIQAEAIRSRSHSITSKHSSSPKEDSPDISNSKILSSKRTSFKNSNKNPSFSMKDRQSFIKQEIVSEPKESYKNEMPAIFKSKVAKKSISSQSSIIHSIKPHKCVKDMTLSELQTLFPDIADLTRIINASKICDNSCHETGKCPGDLLKTIEDAKIKNTKTVSDLINEI